MPSGHRPSDPVSPPKVGHHDVQQGIVLAQRSYADRQAVQQEEEQRPRIKRMLLDEIDGQQETERQPKRRIAASSAMMLHGSQPGGTGRRKIRFLFRRLLDS